MRQSNISFLPFSTTAIVFLGLKRNEKKVISDKFKSSKTYLRTEIVCEQNIDPSHF